MYTGIGTYFRASLIEGIYGQFRIGRPDNYPTQAENFLYQKYYLEFLRWASYHGKLYDTYEDDIKKLKIQRKLRLPFAAVRLAYFQLGAMFAGAVVNPNYVSSQSYYMRKFNVFFFAFFGWKFMQKIYLDSERRVQLRLQFYLPTEIRRAVQDKDWRYFQLIEDPASLYEPTTNRPY